MKITIATTSELKIRALESALERLSINAQVIPMQVDSGVSSQPFGYNETTKGAKNRARGAFAVSDADLVVAIESGLMEIEENYYDIACICVLSKDQDESVAYSSGYFTPRWIIDEIREKNTEYGHITQRLSGDSDKDPIKYFSNGIIRREELLLQAIIIALIKIINKDKYIQK